MKMNNALTLTNATLRRTKGTFEFYARYPMGLSVMNGYRRAARHFGWHTLEDPSTIGTDSYRLFLHRKVEKLREASRKINDAYSSDDDSQVDDLEIWLASQSGLHWFDQDWKYWDEESDLTTLGFLGWSRHVLDLGKRSRITIDTFSGSAVSKRALSTKPISETRAKAKTKHAPPQPPDDSRLMFVPRELSVKGRRNLRVFPANVLFAKVGYLRGEPVMGSALYEPVLSSFKENASIQSLTFANKFGAGSWIVITYDSQGPSWNGNKHVNGKSVGSTSGTEWNKFFEYLTLLGLSDGEPCEFRTLSE